MTSVPQHGAESKKGKAGRRPNPAKVGTGQIVQTTSNVSEALTGRVMDSTVSDALAGSSTKDASNDAADAVRVARASDASMSRIDETSNKKRKSISAAKSNLVCWVRHKQLALA